MSHLPLKLTKVSTHGVTTVPNILPTNVGKSFQINLARLGLLAEGVFVHTMSSMDVENFRKKLKLNPMQIELNFQHEDSKVVPIEGRNLVACVLTDIDYTNNPDGTQNVVGRVTPYGDMKRKLEYFIQTVPNGAIVVIPYFLGRKVNDGYFSVEDFDRFEIDSFYTPPETDEEEVVLREHDEKQLTID